MKDNTGYFTPGRIILHIPHSSTYIPEKYRKLFYLDEDHLQEELLRMTDSYTGELFGLPEIPERNRIIFPYSRLICDVERFRDERMEDMAKRGMGMCYTATSSLSPLKQVTAGHREEMLSLYDRHHEALRDAADRIIAAYGSGLLIDCHSFASGQLPYEAAGKEDKNKTENNTEDEKQLQGRPDICIGTDPDFHTPARLRDFLIKGFEKRGYSVAVNDPFGGTIVPMKHYHKDKRLLSVMIEVNRRLYMDEKTGERIEEFGTVQADIGSVIGELFGELYEEDVLL